MGEDPIAVAIEKVVKNGVAMCSRMGLSGAQTEEVLNFTEDSTAAVLKAMAGIKEQELEDV